MEKYPFISFHQNIALKLYLYIPYTQTTRIYIITMLPANSNLIFLECSIITD